LLCIVHNFDKIITENGEVIIDPSVKNYFIEGYDDDVAKEVQHDLGTTTKAYYDVRHFIDKTDIHIYNASRKSKLDAFERVTFEEALAQIQERNAHKLYH
jgi:formylmethanofuran dehydrogenase subunit A